MIPYELNRFIFKLYCKYTLLCLIHSNQNTIIIIKKFRNSMGILMQTYILLFNIIEKLRIVKINCILNLYTFNILLYIMVY